MNSPYLFSLALGAGLLGGCTMEPHYDRPVAPVPATFSTTAEQAGKGGPAGSAAAPAGPEAKPGTTRTVELEWRQFFSDPHLQQLIDLALRQNRDLRVAALNVETVAAEYRIQRAQLLPTITGNAGVDRVRQPGDLAYPGFPNPESVYTVTGGIANWEIDFFGRLRSLKDQALEQFFASEENRRNVQLMLVSQVATEYFTERALAEEVAVAAQTLKAQQDSLFLSRRSYEVGTANELDFRTAQSQVATAQSDLAALKRQYAATLTALSVLVGGPLPEPTTQLGYLADTGLLADLPAELPSELLDRRPDILQAEHLLKAYNANIGAARAAFFPRITLTASGGTESLRLKGLFEPGSQTWTIDPQLVLPIFEGGTNLANLKIAKVQKLSAAASYEKAVQTAFKEVSDGLTARTLYEDQVAAQRSLVQADEIVYKLAEARYRHGVDSYLVELDAQRNFYAAQQTLIQTRLARLTNLVTLYQSLGGGWNESTPPHGAKP
jgi:multidrug efflux system outer membrane protein